MIEFLDNSPDSNVQESEFKRLLGYPPEFVLSERVKELIESTREWYRINGKPWVYVRQMESFELTGTHFVINDQEFHSERIIEQMKRTKEDKVVAVVVSAGKNCEMAARQFWIDEKPDEYFFMEVYASAVVEHLIAAAAGKICAWADQQSMAALPRYSPGYTDWDIREQQKLFDIIAKDANHHFPEEIEILQSGMLNPKKSLLALFGLTKHLDLVRKTANAIPCHNCSLANCQYRKGAYAKAPMLIEDIGKPVSQRTRREDTILDANAKYSFNTKALEKWTKERLQLQINDDQSVDATFSYQGTTCSNMGHSLEFDYHIKLESPKQNYKIIEAHCQPAPEDSGYTFMCRYTENGELLMRDISNETPLLGKPLNDILSWKRGYNPAACYCSSASREHKWGLVLEVLHYALANQEKFELQKSTI